MIVLWYHLNSSSPFHISSRVVPDQRAEVQHFIYGTLAKGSDITNEGSKGRGLVIVLVFMSVFRTCVVMLSGQRFFVILVL